MMQTRQSADNKNSDERSQRCREHGEFEGDWNERRPTVDWSATDIQRVADRDHIHLHKMSAVVCERDQLPFEYRWPTNPQLATDIQRVADRVRIPLHKISA